MAFQAHGLRAAFEAQGETGFFVYSYGTYDTLEAVLSPGYFNGYKRFEVGDLIFVGTRPRPATNAYMASQKPTEIRRALLMVAEKDEWHRVVMRLVQDYGRPGDPSAALAEVRRGPGRPPKEMRG